MQLFDSVTEMTLQCVPPDTYDYYLWLGEGYRRQGEVALAAQCFMTAGSLAREQHARDLEAEALVHELSLLLEAHQVERARAVYRELAAVSEEPAAWLARLGVDPALVEPLQRERDPVLARACVSLLRDPLGPAHRALMEELMHDDNLGELTRAPASQRVPLLLSALWLGVRPELAETMLR